MRSDWSKSRPTTIAPKICFSESSVRYDIEVR
jgi:hypothetical protein